MKFLCPVSNDSLTVYKCYSFLIIVYDAQTLTGRCSTDLLPWSIQYDNGTSALGVTAKSKVIFYENRLIDFIHGSIILIHI